MDMTALVGQSSNSGYTLAASVSGAPNACIYLPFTAGTSGTATTLNVYLLMNGYASQVKPFIADASKNLLAVGAVISPAGVDGWYSSAISSVSIASGTAYYLGLYFNDNDGLYGHWAGAATGSGVFYDSTSGTYSSPPSTVAGTVNAGVYNFALYADGTAGPSWQLPPGHYVTSALALTIIAPFAGLSAVNRYYRQYPDIAYRVPVVVYGGAYPYQYELTSAPSGMTVGQHYGDTDYGIINWPSPAAGTYSCTVQVTDQVGTVATVDWTLTVTTSGFIFVDAVNGSPSSINGGTGTGSISAPFKNLSDWYSGAVGTGGTLADQKHDTEFSEYFVYYYDGTYSTYAIQSGGHTGDVLSLENNAKPKVHLAVPGSSPVFDLSVAGFEADDSGSAYWIGGMQVNNISTAGDGIGFLFNSGATDTGFFEVTFGTPADPGVSGENPSFIMSSQNDPEVSTRGFISHCTFDDTSNHDFFLGYNTQYWVFEWNTVAGVNDGIGFYAKLGGNDTWTVRNNTGLAANTGRSLVSLDGYSAVTNVDICWNNYLSSGAGIYFGPDTGSTVSDVYSYRNTWQISEQTVDGVPVSGLTVTDDVNQFTATAANAHGYQFISGGSLSSATFTGEECVGLNGGFVDSSGALTGSFRTNYLGTRGHEVA
jgi:hypothetical protein